MKDLNITVTAFVLKDVPPILSLGQLVRNNGCVYEWSGQYPTIRVDDRQIECIVRADVPMVAPAVSDDNAGGDSSLGAASSKDTPPPLINIEEEVAEESADAGGGSCSSSPSALLLAAAGSRLRLSWGGALAQM